MTVRYAFTCRPAWVEHCPPGWLRMDAPGDGWLHGTVVYPEPLERGTADHWSLRPIERTSEIMVTFEDSEYHLAELLGSISADINYRWRSGQMDFEAVQGAVDALLVDYGYQIGDGVVSAVPGAT